MPEFVGLRTNPNPPPEPKHGPDATYIVCDECGREIWDDTDERWIEGRATVLCEECVDRLWRYGAI